MNCVGYYNHRYFLLFSLYFLFAELTFIVLSVPYADDE